MQEHGGSADGLEVRLLVEYEVPVRDVSERGERLVSQPRHLSGQEQHGERQCSHQQNVQRGQEPPGTPHPERLEVYLPPPTPFRQKEGGDQVPAYNEEDLHAQKTARHPGKARVIQQHGDNGERP